VRGPVVARATRVAAADRQVMFVFKEKMEINFYEW